MVGVYFRSGCGDLLVLKTAARRYRHTQTIFAKLSSYLLSATVQASIPDQPIGNDSSIIITKLEHSHKPNKPFPLRGQTSDRSNDLRRCDIRGKLTARIESIIISETTSSTRDEEAIILSVRMPLHHKLYHSVATEVLQGCVLHYNDAQPHKILDHTDIGACFITLHCLDPQGRGKIPVLCPSQKMPISPQIHTKETNKSAR